MVNRPHKSGSNTSGNCSGISFLGSGIIFVSRRQDEVRGLTTAASVWTIAAVGIVVGLGHYTLAVAVTLLVLLVLELARKLEIYFGKKD
jgi:putative Mg2+ transporter-C (MgtC) family protein